MNEIDCKVLDKLRISMLLTATGSLIMFIALAVEPLVNEPTTEFPIWIEYITMFVGGLAATTLFFSTLFSAWFFIQAILEYINGKMGGDVFFWH